MKDGKWGYIDTSGNLVISNQFDTTAPFVEGMARVHFGNQIGYIDKTGRLAINPQFYDAGDFHGGLAAVRTDDGWGFINKTGAFVIKPHFQAADPNGFSGGLAAFAPGASAATSIAPANSRFARNSIRLGPFLKAWPRSGSMASSATSIPPAPSSSTLNSISQPCSPAGLRRSPSPGARNDRQARQVCSQSGTIQLRHEEGDALVAKRIRGWV